MSRTVRERFNRSLVVVLAVAVIAVGTLGWLELVLGPVVVTTDSLSRGRFIPSTWQLVRNDDEPSLETKDGVGVVVSGRGDGGSMLLVVVFVVDGVVALDNGMIWL